MNSDSTNTDAAYTNRIYETLPPGWHRARPGCDAYHSLLDRRLDNVKPAFNPEVSFNWLLLTLFT